MTSRSPIAGSITSASRRSSITTYVPLSYGGTRHSRIRIDRAYPVKSVRARDPDREHQSADRHHAGPARAPRVAPHGELLPLPCDVRRDAHVRARRQRDRRRRGGRHRAERSRAPSHGFRRRRPDHRLRAWPTSAAVFLPNGRPPRVGEILVQRELGALFRRLLAIERSHESEGRANAIMAARDAIYQGDIAEQIAGFMREAGGAITRED